MQGAGHLSRARVVLPPMAAFPFRPSEAADIAAAARGDPWVSTGRPAAEIRFRLPR